MAGFVTQVTSPRCVSFFEPDLEYDDLDCREFAVKRYLRLINSADYRSKPFLDEEVAGNECDRKNLPLPTNIVTIGRRLTPAVKIKILRALAVCPVKYPIRIYQLFYEVKYLGYRYNYKNKIWEYK